MSSKLLKFINHKLQPKELSCHSSLHPTLKTAFCQTNYLLHPKPLPHEQARHQTQPQPAYPKTYYNDTTS